MSTPLVLLKLFVISLVCVLAVDARASDLSDYYERIYQIRVVSKDAGSKVSIGSGFQVDAKGSVLTNFHVISSFVNDYNNNEIVYIDAKGRQGQLELVDFDVISDLALLRDSKLDGEYFRFTNEVVDKGDRAYALGNPGDWGIVLVDGLNNGHVEHRYEPRMLFSGSLNPGMSGGPSLNTKGEVIGVNVATAGSQLSFLVPAAKAITLIDNAREIDEARYQTEIAAQIKRWQKARVSDLLERDWARDEFNGQNLFGEIRKDFQCWGGTNQKQQDRVLEKVDRSCRAGDSVYIDRKLNLGQILFSFSSFKSIKLNTEKFAYAQSVGMGADNKSSYESATNYRCTSDFLDGENEDGFVRIVTCLRAYKKLEGLFDSLLMVMHHRDRESFNAHLSLSGMEKNSIFSLNNRFVEEVMQ